jgi:predicted nucleic acid-binding Zn ribbon protein
MHGGKTVSAVDSDQESQLPREIIGGAEPTAADLARAALAGAQGLSRSAGRRPGRRTPRQRGAGSDAAERTRPGATVQPARGGYSGPDPDGTDPELVGNVLAGYVADRGWEQPLAAARVFTDWAQLVGEDVSVHCRPDSLVRGELRVEAESTAWATQLRLLSATVLARLVAQLGPEVVTSVRFRGPTGPSWKHGGWSVRGARGPRDTYG